MSFLKELTDKGATVAWSEVSAHPNLIALGTKDAGGGSGFDDYGGELELHKMDVSQEGEGGSGAGSVLGKVKTSARFATLAWSGMANKQVEYPYGLIAGGMGDGTVNIWDPAKLIASHPQPQVSSVQRHTGPVTGLHFNPHKSSSHLLASGGADGEIFIMSLDQPDIPNVFVPGSNPNASRHTAEVTKVAWNSQVSHIMATAAQNGSCIIWDLKQKKPWCELRDPNRASITDLAWNPDQGQHIITASGDDNNPVLKLWDLRSSTTLPLATLAGHTEGVLSVAWCPSDSSLLMSCAKDNRTLLWDLFSLKPVYELPPGVGSAVPQETNQMFGGYGKTAQRRYQVSWAPHIPAVVGTCSFDRKVQLFSMNGASTSNGRAPKWLRRPAGASFAFGGRLVSFHSQKGESAKPQRTQNTSGRGVVKVLAVNEDTAFVAASRRFEEAMASKGFTGFCQEKEASATTAHERKVWQFMPVIFERNARNQLLAHLGFEENAVMRQAAAFVGASHNGDRQHNGSALECSKDNDGDNVLDDDIGPTQGKGAAPEESELAAAMDGIDLGASKEEKSGRPATFFGESGPTGASQATGGMPNGDPVRSKEAELVIKRSLLVGNFEAAVQCCMAAGHPADALLLASYGGADLWTNTQNHYLARETKRRPFLKVMGAIVKGELGGLVSTSDLSQWQETLAILSTYASQEQFPDLCEMLAARLENEAGDRKSANLCYMCAVKVPKTVEMWAEELRVANAAMNGGTDTKALQEFVEKVSVFTQESNQLPGEEVSTIFAEYAGILASEGETQTALKYVSNGNTESGAILLDRLYHASQHTVGTPAPTFPFERVRIGVSPQTVVGQAGMAANGANNTSRGQFSSTGTSATQASRGGGIEQPLPPGWTQKIDHSQGIPYYCNAATSQTQWERPTPPHTQPHAQPQRQGVAARRHQTMATAPHAQQGYGRSPHAQQPASFIGNSDPNAITRVGGYNRPYNAFSGGGDGSQQQRQQQQPFQQQQQQQQPFQQQQQQQQPFQQQQQQQQPFQQQQQQHQPATAPPSPASFTSGRYGGPSGGGVGQRLQDTHPPSYEVQAAAPRPGGGHSGFHQERSMAAPGGVGMAPGPSPVSRNVYDYGASAPSTPMQGPMPSPLMPAPTAAPTAAPAATVPPPAAPPSSSQGNVVAAAESRESPAPPSDAESQAVVSAMNGMLGALTEAPLSIPEKKMLGDVTKAAGVLFTKMGRGQVERDTLAMVGDMVTALEARDVKKASGIHQFLANSAWQNHKDWLKGIKHLNTLVARRL